MMIETFTKQDFENFLSSLDNDNTTPYQSLGLIDGEESYLLPLDNQTAIQIRSSVQSNGYSADSGQDSIRAWLVDSNNQPLGSKVSKWTTRKPNWQKRLLTVLHTLTTWRMQAGDCTECGNPLGIYKVRKASANRSRVFAKCKMHDNFKWLDKENGHAYFGERSQNDKMEETKQGMDSDAPGISELENILRETSRNAIPEDELPTSSEQSNGNMPTMRSSIELNEQQKQAVYADIDTNLRVLSGPGSGKTLTIMSRYKYLVESGIAPEKIVCVAFNKTMADELIEKITKALPNLSEVAISQICTINAFCYRELIEYWQQNRMKRLAIYDWKNPYMRNATNPEWMIKDIIDEVYQGWDRKPSADEVLGWIDTSKHTGLSLEDSRGWFNNALHEHGGYIHEIRTKYDAAMQRQGTMDFSDQLYMIERLLIEKVGFRMRLQQKYSHILVDEAQDVSEIALRILLTISQDAGWNKIYQEMR